MTENDRQWRVDEILLTTDAAYNLAAADTASVCAGYLQNNVGFVRW